ncbi:MAG: hypothetical protein ACREJB_14565 [Planctomycetaceae bacterium]
MGPHDLRDFLRTRPFVPFRLHTSEGRAYEIRHPDEALVLLTRVALPAPTDADDEFSERLEHVALAHVVRVEELPSAASRSGG